ncbi:MAG: hypothetical protein RH942_00585 [Kiloniellaceae bacterium]
MVLWKYENGWRYEYFEPDVQPSSVPQFEDLVTLWQSKRNGRRVPAKRDFDFYDFKGWHGWISLHDVTYDPFDYLVRLSGTKIDDLYGTSIKGFDREGMNRIYAETSNRDAFDEMNCLNLTISHITGPLNVAGRTYNRVAYLELPLSDDGERADSTIEATLPHRDGPA